MVIICITCQSAIFIKKFKEKRKDRQIPFTEQISLSLNEEDNKETDQPACIKAGVYISTKNQNFSVMRSKISEIFPKIMKIFEDQPYLFFFKKIFLKKKR